MARRGYAVLAAVLLANQSPTAVAPVAMDDTGLELADGIEAKQVYKQAEGDQEEL